MIVSERINSSKRVIVYGARLIALELVLRLRRSYSDKLWGCVVSSMDGNPDCLAGYPVYPMSECEKLLGEGWQKETCVILGLSNNFYQEIHDTLEKINIQELTTYEELIADEAFLNAWKNCFTSCKRIALLGEPEEIPRLQNFFESVFPKYMVKKVAENEVQPTDLVLLAMDASRYMYWIKLVGRLCDRGCLNIMDARFLYEFARSPRGGDILVPTLLWERKNWRDQAHAVINSSRLQISTIH